MEDIPSEFSYVSITSAKKKAILSISRIHASVRSNEWMNKLTTYHIVFIRELIYRDMNE